MAKSLQFSVREAVVTGIPRILDISNEAFIIDAYFKKPEYANRFSTESIGQMMQEENSLFFVAERADDARDPNDFIVGSLFLHWEVTHDVEHNRKTVKGKFSAVAVPPRFEKCGVGQGLVAAAEKKIIEIANGLAAQDGQQHQQQQQH